MNCNWCDKPIPEHRGQYHFNTRGGKQTRVRYCSLQCKDNYARDLSRKRAKPRKPRPAAPGKVVDREKIHAAYCKFVRVDR